MNKMPPTLGEAKSMLLNKRNQITEQLTTLERTYNATITARASSETQQRVNEDTQRQIDVENENFFEAKQRVGDRPQSVQETLQQFLSVHLLSDLV